MFYRSVTAVQGRGAYLLAQQVRGGAVYLTLPCVKGSNTWFSSCLHPPSPPLPLLSRPSPCPSPFPCPPYSLSPLPLPSHVPLCPSLNSPDISGMTRGSTCFYECAILCHPSFHPSTHGGRKSAVDTKMTVTELSHLMTPHDCYHS